MNKYTEGIKKNGKDEKQYCMNPYEIVTFMDEHLVRLVNHPMLHGRRTDREDAVCEVKMKVLGVPVACGKILTFKEGQLEEARTTQQWLTFLAWQARGRLNVLRKQTEDWYHPDAKGDAHAAGLGEDDGLSAAEAAFVAGMEKAADERYGKVSDKTPEYEPSPDEEAPKSKMSAAQIKWQEEELKKLARIRGYIEFEKDRTARPFEPGREEVREAIRSEVRRLAEEAGWSSRDIEGYCKAVFNELSAKEILKEMKAFGSTGNIDRVKCLVGQAVKKAARRPNSKLALLYAA